MKISFMTFMCPEWSADQAIAGAVQNGYDGIEFRASSGHKHGVEPGASEAELSRIRRALEGSGIEAACLATSITLANVPREKRGENLDKLRRHIEAAAAVGARRIRVFGGNFPGELPRAEAEKRIAESLAAVDGFAIEHGVKVLIETHDAFRLGEQVAAPLAASGARSVGAVWDHMHPFFAGQAPKETHRHLRGWVEHCHVHDGKRGAKGLLPIGQGEVPIWEILKILKGDGFSGYLSAEYWVDLGPPEEALPAYISAMRAWVAQL